MKQRFTYLDIRAMTNELSMLLTNSYIQQIYTPTPHIFIFKTSSKHLLLVEPGIRLHTVLAYTSAQSFFTPKIRILKHNTIKSISQVGFDRVVKMVTNKYTVYFEFFAGGNVVITQDDIIIEVYRPVKEMNIVKGEIYVVNEVGLVFNVNFWMRRGIREMIGGDKIVADDVLSNVSQVLQNEGFYGADIIDLYGKKCYEEELKLLKYKNEADEIEKINTVETNTDEDSQTFLNASKKVQTVPSKETRYCVSSNLDSAKENNQSIENKKLSSSNPKKNKKINDEYKTDSKNYRKQNVNSDMRTNISVNENKAYINEFLANHNLILKCNEYFGQLYKKFQNLSNYGMLMYKKEKANYFLPLKITSSDNTKEFSSFNEALQVYFSKKEEVNIKKSSLVKDRQEKRIQELKEAIIEIDKNVELLYNNLELINQVLKAHENVIKYNLDWKDFERHKKQEKKLNEIILKSDFKNYTVKIKLPKLMEDTEIDISSETEKNMHKQKIEQTDLERDKDKIKTNERTDKHKLNDKRVRSDYYTEIELKFMIDFHNNIELMYEMKKKHQNKLQKTILNINAVVKKVESKEGKKSIKKEKINRKIYWFEKFNYFFTTNQKLVISGKNAQQNDILVKKYLTKSDLYFHAEIQGAASVILLDGNKCRNDVDIEEAALMALCMSSSWKKKVVTKVFYVESEQVSKTTESGEYLKTGGFIIRGKKNYVDVFRLEYGLGILFKYGKDKVEESSDLFSVDETKEISVKQIKLIGLDKESSDTENLINNDNNIIIKNDSNIQDFKDSIKDKSCMQESKEELSLNDTIDGVNPSKNAMNEIDNNNLVKDLNVLNEKTKDGMYKQLDILALKNEAAFNFTSMPKDDEILEHSLLVCAPWKIIKNYQYKSKLLPGVDKKGKIAMEIFKKFNRESSLKTEKNLVKNITIDEYMNVLITNCKLGKFV